MSKRKKPAVEAFDKDGPQNLPEGYTWCQTCQASYQGDTCPRCPEPNQPGDDTALKGPGNMPPEAVIEGGKGQGQGYEGDPGAESPPHAVTENPDPSSNDPTTLAEVAASLPDVETTIITEILPVPLTDAEYKEIGKQQAQANQEIAQAEDELKSVRSQYKSRIDSAEARRNEYAAIINAGHQQKQVECCQVKDFRENTVTLVRLDTHEIVRTRTMTAGERQRGLFLAGEATPTE